MKLKIKISYFVWCILGLVSFGGLAISGLNLSNIIYCFADFFNIMLFLCACYKIRNHKGVQGLQPFKVLLICFLIITLLGIIGNGVNPLLALWGMRNVYRYILFFISCIILLDRSHIALFLEKLPIIYWVNFGVTIIQFFVFDIKQDYLGGIFGVAQGCNGATTIFINIVISFIIAQYLNGKRKLVFTIPYILAYFVTAVLSETKGNFVFFVLNAILVFMFSKKTYRSILFGGLAICGIVGGMWLLNVYFPESVQYLLDWESANAYMDASYFNKTTFTRNAIFTVTNKYFFKDSIWLYMFGYGIGACDMSSYFESPFFQQYGDMNYRQYSSAMTILQTGYLGFCVFLLFIGAIVIYVLKNDKRDKTLMVAVASVAIFAVVDSFYASIYVDMGYWIFFVLSIPFIIVKSWQRSYDIEIST